MRVASTAGSKHRMGVVHLPGQPGAPPRVSCFASFADFVTDHAADSGAADGSDRAAARKNCASYGTGTGADLYAAISGAIGALKHCVSDISCLADHG